MVDAILLILREVLEAALIITMLMIMSHKLSISLNWLTPSLVCGIFISWLFAHYAYAVADSLNGTGQEWMNALLYLVVILSFVCIGLIIAPLLFCAPSKAQHLTLINSEIKSKGALLISCAALAVGLSLVREVAEIWIYLGGFLHQPEVLQSALMGGAIGVGIGASLGVITYYLLVFISAKIFLRILYLFLIFMCGGLSMQIAKQLLQIGLLDSVEPLWDTSNVINEHSWLGELLYALVGYDSNPSAIQVIFYLIATTPLLLCLLWNWYHGNQTHE